MERLPNGWPQPTFFSIDPDDGSLNIEWCFGAQGAADSYCVMFVYDPVEGVMACKTTHANQECDETNDATLTLAKWLDQETGR